MTKTVLVTDHAWPSLDIERSVLAEVGAEVIVAPPGNDTEIVALAANAEAIMTNWRKVPTGALDVASKCQVIARYGVGVDNIPVDHATKLGILVTNVPDFCVDEVTDHAMALLLACARRIVRFDTALRSHGWDFAIVAPGMQRLRGQTLGLIGYGKLGQLMAKKALAFGLELIVYTPRLDAGELEPHVFATNDLEVASSRSDYVSLHVPATESTRNMIDEAAFRTMKPSAYLINTARGAVVDESALIRALSEGWIAGACIDVMASEPLSLDSELRRFDNVVLTPHAAFYSEQAIEDLEHRAASQVADVLAGRLPPNIVNPQVLERSGCRFAH